MVTLLARCSCSQAPMLALPKRLSAAASSGAIPRTKVRHSARPRKSERRLPSVSAACASSSTRPRFSAVGIHQYIFYFALSLQLSRHKSNSNGLLINKDTLCHMSCSTVVLFVTFSMKINENEEILLKIYFNLILNFYQQNRSFSFSMQCFTVPFQR